MSAIEIKVGQLGIRYLIGADRRALPPRSHAVIGNAKEGFIVVPN